MSNIIVGIRHIEMGKHINTILLLFSIFFLHGQSPYSINLKKDLPIMGIVGAAWTGSIFFAKGVDPLTEQQINELNSEDLNSFDRSAVFNTSESADQHSDIFQMSAIAFPVLLLLDKGPRRDISTMAILTTEVILLNGLLTTLSKATFRRTRPFVYNETVPLERKLAVGARFSFYSGHTSGVSALSFFAAKVINDFHPQSKLKPFIWSAAAIIPATTGYLRYKSGSHFPTDIIAGFLSGAVIGILVPQIHKRKTEKLSNNVHITAETNGLKFVLMLK